MAEKRPSFLRGLAGRVGDRLVWGKNYNPQTGRFTATPTQVIGGIGSRALNFLIPGAGTAANIAGNAYYGSGPLGFLGNRGPGQVQPQGLDQNYGGVSVPNAAQTIAAPNMNLPSGFMPSAYGPYAGGYQFPGPMAPMGPTINPISGLPNTQTGYGVELPNYGSMPQAPMMGGRPFGTAAGSFTPWGASSYQNDPWGETAAGFGVGAAQTASQRQTGSDWAGRRYEV